VTVDTLKNQITVKGTMKTKGFAELLSQKIQRHVEVVGQKEKKKKEEEEEQKEEEKKEEEKSCAGQMTCHADMGWCHCDKCGYHVYMIPAPQLFSDENPNACSVM
jgi:DNA-directed RNA polymerase alpha subunit